MAESRSSKTAREAAGTASRNQPATRPMRPAATPTNAVGISEPTDTGSVTYDPAFGDPEIVTIAGRVFEAGKAVDIDDPRLFAKLKGNPQFTTGGRRRDRDAAPAGRAAAAIPPELAKARDRLAEEEDEARQTFEEAAGELSAAERARRQVEATAEAMSSPDRDPPLTNHATNRP
jgi:hypothetical protein